MNDRFIKQAIAITERNVEIAIGNEEIERRNALVELRNEAALALNENAELEESEESEELEDGGYGFSMVESRLTY